MTRIRKRNFVRRILLENRVNLIRSIRRGLKLERIIGKVSGIFIIDIYNSEDDNRYI